MRLLCGVFHIEMRPLKVGLRLRPEKIINQDEGRIPRQAPAHQVRLDESLPSTLLR